VVCVFMFNFLWKVLGSHSGANDGLYAQIFQWNTQPPSSGWFKKSFFDKDSDYCNPKDRGRFFRNFDNHLPTDIIPKEIIILKNYFMFITTYW